MLRELIETLHEGGFSLVVGNGHVETFTNRGVADLYGLYTGRPEFLDGASVADKVVGKAAAALMILGGVAELHADVISEHAVELLEKSRVSFHFDKKVPHIINRSGTGWCPLETRCRDMKTPEECFQQIKSFVESNNLKP